MDTDLGVDCTIVTLDDVAIDFPELRFNVEHMGYPWTEELLALMARSPNAYTDIAMFVDPYVGIGRPLLLARNLGMAREYGVLDRVFYGSDYVGEDIDEYVDLLHREIAHIRHALSRDMERLGYPPLTQQEMEGLLWRNVLGLWKRIDWNSLESSASVLQCSLTEWESDNRRRIRHP